MLIDISVPLHYVLENFFFLMLALQHLSSYRVGRARIPDWFLLLPFTLLYELKQKSLFCVFLFLSGIGKKLIESDEKYSEIQLMSFFLFFFFFFKNFKYSQVVGAI